MAGKSLEQYKRYGWKVNETNLLTLPPTAPKAAQDLTKWLTLEGRRSSLEEWLGCVKEEDSRIHGKFWHIGAWTHRMSHSNPNQANIPSVLHLGKYHPVKLGREHYMVTVGTNESIFEDFEDAYAYGRDVWLSKGQKPVDHVKAKYDGASRSCFKVPDGHYLVGCDAEGIQLRILAHYMKSKDYVEAIVDGRKEDLTDIHNLNKRALGSVCKDRDTAKTFNIGRL